jgi:hypothetical protein
MAEHYLSHGWNVHGISRTGSNINNKNYYHYELDLTDINKLNIFFSNYKKKYKGILKYFILKWNKINWEEDMPLKVRRQKAIDLGFRDFRGIVGEERGRKQNVRLPIPRSKDSIINHGCTESIQID